jgi:hypothetical protein
VTALYTLHRVLIGAAVGLGGLFALYCLWQYRVQGGPMMLLLAAVSLAAGGALAAYLRWFLRKRATQTPPP